MYVYTDDDLSRVNRDYLGPKGKRLPFVLKYRTYGISFAILAAMWGLFVFVGLPVNQWTLLLFFFASALVIIGVVKRLQREVSVLESAIAGWQEVTVPRAEKPNPHAHVVQASVRMRPYDIEPEPRWWEFRKLRAASAMETPSRREPKTRAERRRVRS
ncbi:hypothetical protein [Microbacterium sp.]|uniref:hypothetical protein n=1 Tax=Microbacterium sp. TaxID=51671 RepID=UPI003F9E0C5C